jgi:adenylate cyclase
MAGAPASNGNGRRLPRPVVTILLALAAALAVAALSHLPAWQLTDDKLYDIASTVLPPVPDRPGVVVVAIDEPSLAEIGRQWPWPRDLHARLVEKLRAAGATAIAIDLIFAEPSTPEADAALAAAMGDDVILAAEVTAIETPQAVQTIVVEPIDALTAAGAEPGIASVFLDGDGTLRRMPRFADGFAARLLATADGTADAAPPAVPEGALIQYFGPPRTYPTVSYYQALDPAAFLPPNTFAGSAVIVGHSLQNAPELGTAATDVFETAFTATTGRLSAGAEVQATVFDNLRHGLYVVPAPTWARAAALAAGALLALAFAVRLVTWRTAGWVALAVLTMLIGSWALLRFGRVWLPPIAPAVALVAATTARAGLDFAEERRLRRRIAAAFAHYLAPALVDRLARDPAALKLGGERRTLSVLFCDVRRFTAIAEALKNEPERLTTLVNRLLDPLSEAVLDEGGTIDKFIGDCVMAFWNAPLPEPRHAERAVRAGLAMIEAVARLNRAVAAEAAPGMTVPMLAVGVGVNTGDCVVGNFGSQRRFDYSALGDAVNLASRLEGLSTLYRVPLLVGPDTAAAVAGVLTVVELDRVAVKGRGDAVAVSTVLGDLLADPNGSPSAALQAHAAMLAAYRRRDWDAAERHAATASAALPALAGYYAMLAERIAGYRASPPPTDWNGSFAATEK